MVRFAKYAIALFVLVLLAAIAIPKLLSTEYVKERVAGQLSEISGRVVSLNGGSSISLLPYLSVTYHNVSIGEVGKNNEPALIVMDSLKARLGIFSAIGGEARLAEMEMIRPRFNLNIGKNGGPNWLLEKGPLADRLSLEPGIEPESLPLGKINIMNGIVQINDERSRVTHKLTGLNGSITWANVTGSGALNLDAVWQGEIVKIDAVLGSPFELLRGGKSNVEAILASNPLNASFSGTVDSLANSAKGHLSAASPSASRLTEWLGNPIPVTGNLAATSISGEVTASFKTVAFQEATVTIGEDKGVGRIQFSIEENDIPSIVGTLAFDTLSLPEYTQSMILAGNNISGNEAGLFSLLHGFGLDLRISVNSATSSIINLTNLAASIIVRNEGASFDIGSSETLGGTLIGSLALDTNNQQASISANLSFNDVNLDQLGKIYGENIVTVNGKGNAEFNLKSVGTSPNMLMQRLNGEGNIRGENGLIEGIDLAGMLVSIKDKSPRVGPLLEGSTAYEELNIGFFIANGIAFFRGSEMQNDGIIVTLGGRTDLAQRSLALRGRISTKTSEGEADQNNSLPFFVGGTTISPLFVPLPGTANPTPSQINKSESVNQ